MPCRARVPARITVMFPQAAPIEPPPNRWRLPPAAHADEQGFVAAGADLEPGTLLAAYRQGLFPMPLRKRVIGWWSPDPRGILPLDGLHVSRSLRQSRRRFDVRFNTSFREVMQACGDPTRPHGWINSAFVDAYGVLHALGWAHSIEVFHDDELVGGLYGLRIGRFFAGESMFHRMRDASKVAMMATVDWLVATDAALFDVQWTTDHLISMGAVDVPRDRYLRLLAAAIGDGATQVPPPAV
jgi:leucyl/phenylalanyl-tRNA---protein transferase